MPDVKHFDEERVMESILRLFWREGGSSAGVEKLVGEAGINRSSLYATFGKKRELYVGALRRYLETRSFPEFERLAKDQRGMPAISDFFQQLIDVRFFGKEANWGCMASNAHSHQDCRDPKVKELLSDHHDHLKAAMRSALVRARSLGQLAMAVDPEASAQMLTLVAYGINLRSRAGADGKILRRDIEVALKGICSDGYLAEIEKQKEGKK